MNATPKQARPIYELFSSMRFAITLFTLLAIASVIGTVLKQNQAYADYIIKFGEYWFSVFKVLGLFDVYHTAWFITILAFLVLSTSTCIYRNLPSMLREMRNYREQATEQSLRHFHHQAEFSTTSKPVAALKQYLDNQGFHYREREQGDSLLIAAKRGSANRLGYLFTHGAIVLICLGGLIDGNLPLQIEQALGIKHIETRDIPASQVPATSRLSTSNLSFRGNVTLPEGDSADVIFINVGDGYLVQELPFRVGLKKFHIEHYSTGQPKAFASDITVFDKDTDKPVMTRTITVNHPLIYKGVAIYQASFGDGGTHFKLDGWNLHDQQGKPFAFSGSVHDHTPLDNGGQTLSIEFTDFHPFNIESTGEEAPKDSFGGNAVADHKNLHNVGPSFEYKIRNPDGQAREFSNYMLPVLIENRWYMVSGMRSAPNEPYHYLRMPLDPQSTLSGFMRLRGAMLNENLYPQIARQFAQSVLPDNQDGQQALIRSTIKELGLFAHGGYPALSDFIEHNIPQDQRDQAAQAYLKILELSAWQAYNMTQASAGEPAPKMDDATGWFLRDSLNAINDIFFYGAPVYLQLASFDQVQSSGLQMTRSPGKNIVYLGSFLLVLGVFTMFFVQERRLWLLVKPNQLLFAMSGNRLTLDFENEFSQRRQHIADLVKET